MGPTVMTTIVDLTDGLTSPFRRQGKLPGPQVMHLNQVGCRPPARIHTRSVTETCEIVITDTVDCSHRPVYLIYLKVSEE